MKREVISRVKMTRQQQTGNPWLGGSQKRKPSIPKLIEELEEWNYNTGIRAYLCDFSKITSILEVDNREKPF